jgi:hypothetical protein
MPGSPWQAISCGRLTPAQCGWWPLCVSGGLRVLCTTVQIGPDWFDEDHIVVDCEGRIIVQSRQLAMVPQVS